MFSFYVKKALFMQIPGPSTPSFIPPHLQVLNQTEEFEMKSDPPRPSPSFSPSRMDYPQREWVLSCYGQIVSLAMKTQSSWYKLYLVLKIIPNFEFWYQEAGLSLDIIHVGNWEQYSQLSRYFFFQLPFPLVLFLKWFRIQAWNNEALYWTLEIINIFHNLTMFALWHKWKCITQHSYRVYSIACMYLKQCCWV